MFQTNFVEKIKTYTGLVKIMLTLMDYFSPRNVCPGVKWYSCSLVVEC